MNIQNNLKRIYENKYTGARTFQMTSELASNANRYLQEVHGVTLKETARKFNTNAKGHKTFMCGLSYDVIDMDLLGGNGDGSRVIEFQSWLADN